MSSTGDRLREAAERVRNGWVQGKLHDLSGNVCAMGGLGITDDRQTALARERLPELLALVRAIGKEPRPGSTFFTALVVCEVGLWNDAKGQTQENVATTLELAAILADEEDAGKRRAVDAAMTGWNQL